MKITISLLVLVALALAGCGQGDLDYHATLKVPEGAPNYEVIDESGPVELLADTDSEGARQAIADWLGENADGRDYVVVQVIDSPGAGSVLCRVEYVGSEDANQDGRLTSDDYPSLFLGSC